MADFGDVMLGWASGQVLVCEAACSSGGGVSVEKKEGDKKGILQLTFNTQYHSICIRVLQRNRTNRTDVYVDREIYQEELAYEKPPDLPYASWSPRKLVM